jgi:5-methylthioribose kinase
MTGGRVVRMKRRPEFERAFPRGFFLDQDDPAGLELYLRERGWVGATESLLSIAKAGEGNMNLVLRVVNSSRSIILKQARPWVEKYPSIGAPAGRAEVEVAFYEAASSRPPLRERMARLLGSDPASGVVVLEDLGEAQDFTALYRGARLSEVQLAELVSYLAELHRPFEVDSKARLLFANRDMRALNHEHVFRLPLAPDNGLDLDRLSPGLDAAAAALKNDVAYVDAVRRLGDSYLEDGPALVHGDYFPGSWLRTESGIRVIDPEFCFLGAAAFDVGVMLAHLHLSRQPIALGEALLSRYAELCGAGASFLELSRRFAGCEIMRRLLGVAQLPLTASLEEKAHLLALSRDLVLC